MDFFKSIGSSVGGALASAAKDAVSSKNVVKTISSAVSGTAAGKSLNSALNSGPVGSIVKSIVPATRDGDMLSSLISTVYNLIAAHLPFDWGTSEEEEHAQDSSLSEFSNYMAQPTAKPIYEKELQTLDKMGVVDLGRISREQWPKKETSYFTLISINTYEKESYALGSQVVTDAINVAQVYKDKGYRLAYLFNVSAKDFYKWADFFIESVKKEVVVYFAGIATNIVSGSNITQVLAFRDEAKKVDGSGGGSTKIEAVPGVGTNSVSEEQLFDIVDRTAKPALRTVFIHNVVNQSSAFTPSSKTPILSSSTRGSAKHIVPPHQTILVQFNSSSGSNQHTFVDKFTRNPGTTFTQLRGQLTAQSVAVDPNGGVTITAKEDPLLAQPIIAVIPAGDEELQIEEAAQLAPTKPNKLPDPNVLSPAEVEGAEQRWALFTAEMKKSPTYDTKYKASLQKLDSMGCINLERLDRSQIPNMRIDRVAALFFCPYEDLEHTLDLGPVNDGLTMANLYLSKGYKIVYLMDATPKEFYSWIDWLLSNVRGEIVVYFSGHGTQMKDSTGKEADGMSELLVFYNDSKKSTRLPKIPAVPGVTDMTVSDDCLHKLIILKDYPDTRIVLMSDCCHSGTMYNFDQSVSIAPTRPPLNVIAVGAAKDSQTAKQTVLGGKESGVYTYSLDTVIRQKATATFNDLETYTKKNIAKYQDINITYTNKALLTSKIITESTLSSDPTSRNYSPVVLTDTQLKSRALKHKTSIPPDGKRVRRPRLTRFAASSSSSSSYSSSSSSSSVSRTVPGAMAAPAPQKAVPAPRKVATTGKRK